MRAPANPNDSEVWELGLFWELVFFGSWELRVGSWELTTNQATELPGWAEEMRDLFRSGSSAQFLLHGNVFDVVPSGGKLLSVPAFLEQVMFANYDVVLRYDRSRGVRATRGADDWGEWLQNALGREASSQT